MDDTATRVPVLKFRRYMGATGTSAFGDVLFCGRCHRKLGGSYNSPLMGDASETLEEMAAEFEDGVSAMGARWGGREYEHWRFCPFCGAEWQDEWWKGQPIQNERVVDHFDSPGTHAGDTHSMPMDAARPHTFASSDGSLCWCAPLVNPSLLGCEVRHRDISKCVEEFEAAYAARSGVTVEWLHEHGRFGSPCHCEEPTCEGWQMARGDDAG